MRVDFPHDASRSTIDQGRHPGFPIWAPRFWHGMLLDGWLRLLARHRFRVHLSRIPTAASITCVAAVNSVVRAVHDLIYGRRIRQTELVDPPIFILGHWRSGTTHLHELLSLDGRFATPTTYQCFAPHHFIVSEWLIAGWMRFLLPNKRPMDHMRLGWDQPQEDEFALCSLGIPSPYYRMAFPNDGPCYQEYFDFAGLTEEQRGHWRDALLNFMRRVTLHRAKRIVLKSPPHTGRVRWLAEWFPGARFIHLVRNPTELIPSTLRLWKTLDDLQAMQVPDHRQLEDYVFDTFARMYGGFERQRIHIPEGHLYELRYEDLVSDPVGEMEKIYESLQLGQFAGVRGSLEAFVKTQQNYQRNRHEIGHELKERIERELADYIHRYGYDTAIV